MPLAIVHHANQFLVTDGYDDREGIDVIASGYVAVLRLHEKHGIPASLHLSGTLVETLAWHRPDVLELVRGLLRDGLLELVGGSYAAAILTAFGPDYVTRQLSELLALYARHLGARPEVVRTAWVPERVWDTERLARLLADPSLPNGGYRSVLLDDRLLFSLKPAYETSERARFDAAGPYAARPRAAPLASLDVAQRVHRIAGGRGLTVVPISAALRYAIPPRDDRAWQVLSRTAAALRGDPSSLVTYADDLERVAGVGGWDVTARDAYAEFLARLATSNMPIARLGEALRRPPEPERDVEPGTYYELAHEWSAGEDCAGWLGSAAWRPYRAMLERSIERVREAERQGGDGRLVELAWKHVLASGYETAWHDRMPEGHRVLSGWARAIASHARAALVIARVALWRARGAVSLAELRDVDEDGETEVVLAQGDLYAVLVPRDGARVSYLFARGALVIGNPTDDWNLEQSLGAYMDAPPNHPGAFADVHGRRDRYVVEACRARGGVALARFRNIEVGSRLFGLRKSFLLNADTLATCYRRPDAVPVIEADIGLSPDYLVLLREGRPSLQVAPAATGWDLGGGEIALRLSAQHGFLRLAPEQAGHAIVLRARIASEHDHLILACGARREWREDLPGTERAGVGEG